MTLEPATDWQHQLPEAHDYEALDERDPHVSPAVSHCVGLASIEGTESVSSPEVLLRSESRMFQGIWRRDESCQHADGLRR